MKAKASVFVLFDLLTCIYIQYNNAAYYTYLVYVPYNKPFVIPSDEAEKVDWLKRKTGFLYWVHITEITVYSAFV